MKKLYLITLSILALSVANAQNVGVDVATPQQKLDVAGAIKIGSTTTGAAGSLRWNGTEFQFHDGTNWVTLNANTDDQVLDIIQLNGTDLEISIENDGQATYAIDLSSFLDNTDAQQFDQVSINGSNQLLLSLSNDGQATHVLDLSGYLDNTDEQQFDIVQLSGTNLELSLQNDGVGTHVIDLSSLAVDTDDQALDVAQLTGTNLELSLEDDGVATEVIDLSGFMDNTDNQTFDVANITSDELRLSLEDDAQATVVLDLAPYKDNTDDQQFDVVQLTGNNLELSLEDDGQATHSIDLSGFADNTDDQTIDVLTLAGNTLNISLEDDGVANETLNLSQFMDNTDDQALNDFSVSGNILSLNIEDAGGIQTVNLAPYLDNTDNQEITQFNLSGNTLQITLEDDAGGQETVDLSGYLDNTDNQAVTTFSLSGTDLQLQVEDDAGGLQTVDLDPLRRLLVDADGDTKIEVEATADEDQIRLTTAGGEAMRINATQQVGIGLSTGIQNQLVVQGSNSDTRSVLGLRGGNGQNTFANGAQIAFGYDGDASFQHFIHTRHNSAGGSPNNAIDFYVTDGTQFNTVTSGSTHVMSLNSGSVGIGVENPSQKLHVSGGTARISALSGGASKIVMADANGDLSAVANLNGSGLGDNLGNHTATSTLEMVNNEIDDVGYLDMTPGDGRGIRFWSSNSYSIAMGNAGEYHYGPVTDYSIKSHMSSDAGRGWTWGIDGATPVAAINNVGDMQVNRNMTAVGHFYGRSVNASYSNIYRMGGMYFTWDSDSYGTNTHHSIRSTYGDGYGDNITLNSFNHIRFNVDANNNNSTSYFEVGDNTTGTGNIFFRLQTGGDMALNGKHAIRSNDSWLRLNQDGAFSSGTYTPGHLRADGGFTSGSSGNPGAGRIRSTYLAGGGNRLVMTDNSGTMYPVANLNGSGLGDNLGNHTATTNLNMTGRDVINVRDIFTTATYGRGRVGLYASSRWQNVFSMGAAYRLAASGTNAGNLYGIAWTHSNVGSGSVGGLGHQMVIKSNGDTRSVIGDGMWTKYTSYFPFIYDYNNTGYYLDPNSTSRMSVNITNENYTYGWFRNQNAQQGLYNQSTGNHFYSTDDNYWDMDAQRGLRLRTGYNSTIRGYLYTDGGSSFGLLHSGGGWAVRTYSGGGELYGTFYANDFRPYIIYDRNNTGYYWNGDGTSRMYYGDFNYLHTQVNDSWFPYTGNNRNYFRGNSYVTNAVWWDENNTGYYMDLNGGNRLAYLYAGIGAYNVTGWMNGRFQTASTSDGHQYHPLTGNWGYIGTSGQYWWYMYTNNFVNVSRRETKRDIIPIQEETADYLMADIEKLKPSFYKYKVETDEFETGNEPKYRANMHIGLILDESPDYLQDQAFSGIDIYALSALGIAGVKHNREEIKKLQAGKGTTKIEDFGSASMDGETLWVEFEPSFTDQLVNGEIPVVSVTPGALGAEIAVIDKTSEGFMVRKVGTNPLNFDWIAKARIKPQVETPARSLIAPELLSQLEVDEARKVAIKAYWAEQKKIGVDEHARQAEEHKRIVADGEAQREIPEESETLEPVDDSNYVEALNDGMTTPASEVNPDAKSGDAEHEWEIIDENAVKHATGGEFDPNVPKDDPVPAGAEEDRR